MEAGRMLRRGEPVGLHLRSVKGTRRRRRTPIGLGDQLIDLSRDAIIRRQALLRTVPVRIVLAR